MSGEQSIDLLWGVGALVLVLGALSIRSLTIGALVRMIVQWALIFALAMLAVSYRYELMGVWERVTGDLFGASQTVAGDTLRVRMAPDGHFWVEAEVNEVPVRFLVDSGATITALSTGAAERAGVERDALGLPAVLTTANGVVAADRGHIDRLDLGPIDASDLPIVISQSFGDTNVLGMNFLSRLHSWRVEGRTLILEPTPPTDAGT